MALLQDTGSRCDKFIPCHGQGVSEPDKMNLAKLAEEIERREKECSQCNEKLTSLDTDIHGSVYSICPKGHCNIITDNSKSDRKYSSAYYLSLSLQQQSEFARQQEKPHG